MDKLLSIESGIPALLAAIVVFMALHLFKDLLKFLWDVFKKKNEATDKNLEKTMDIFQSGIRSIDSMNVRLGVIEKDLVDFPKFKKDLNRMFFVLKMVSGNKWPQIMRALDEEEKMRNGK